MRGELKARAIDAAIAQLDKQRGAGVFRYEAPGYTREPAMNLIEGVTERDFTDDLACGDGSELKDQKKSPAKFCAAHSSSALCVNVFAPFRRAPENLILAGETGFTEARFERKCSTGLRGNSPNLDFFAQGDSAIVGVESKYLEPLAPKRAKFSDAYDRPIKGAGSGWRSLYSMLRADPGRFVMVDAAQLVKHYLGLQHTFADAGARIILMYVYWEPANASALPEYQEHRREVAEFSELAAEDRVEFVAVSYPQLWEYWESESKWPGMPEHLRAARERYDYPIAS